MPPPTSKTQSKCPGGREAILDIVRIFGTICAGYARGDRQTSRDFITPIAKQKAQTDYEWEIGWVGNVLSPHMTLIDSFMGTLSPTEAMLSSCTHYLLTLV